MNDLPQAGFLRLTDIVGRGKLLPISKSAWWAGVKSGRYPQPVKLGPNTTAWPVSKIRELLERINRGELAA